MITINIIQKLRASLGTSKNIIIFTYVFIALAMIFGVVVSNMIKDTVDSKYHQFMYKNEELTKLPILIEESKNTINRYLKDKNEEDLAAYQATNLKIDRILELIKEDSIMDTKTLIFYGSLSRMYEYQTNLVDEIITLDMYTSEEYDDITYLRDLFKYMVTQANHLTTAYLSYSSHEYNTLFQSSKQVESIILMCIVILAGISIFIGIFLSKGIFSTLNNISKKAKLLSKGEWDTDDLESIPYKELNNVVQAFNQMKRSIKIYIEELKTKADIEKQLQDEKLHNLEKDRLLKKSQIQTLQMQMNPHFLFNTLNMTSRTIKLNESETAVKLIESIAKILRYNMENKKDQVLLKNEIPVLEAYIYIQHLRFQDRIEFSITGEEPYLDANIQPMILQPLVENAIIHGLSDITEYGKIEIHFSQIKDRLRINVTDNGVGMEEEKVNQIINDCDVEDKNRGIGLSNIRKRLLLQYGNDHSFSIKSSKQFGTQIEIIIPLTWGLNT